MKLQMHELESMPIRDRKFYIELHNRAAEQKRESLNVQKGLRDADPDAWLDNLP